MIKFYQRNILQQFNAYKISDPLLNTSNLVRRLCSGSRTTIGE